MKADGERRDSMAHAVAKKLGLADEKRAEAVLEAVLATARERLVETGAVELPGLVRLSASIEREAGAERGTPVVRAVALGALEAELEAQSRNTILLAVPEEDTFARVVTFHFERAGWRVRLRHDVAGCLKALGEDGAHLVIVDTGLPQAGRLISEIKCSEGAATPVVSLYPSSRDPSMSSAFRVAADEHLVEPFEVYTLLMLAESELRRSRQPGSPDRRVRVQLGGSDDDREQAADLIGRLARQAGFAEEEQVGFVAAVREAVVNAFEHGHQGDLRRPVRVVYEETCEAIRVTITDDGSGFNHQGELHRSREQDPMTAAQERREQGRTGGLGLMLMQRCADEVRYNARGNQVTLTKRRGPASARDATACGAIG